MQGGDKLWLPLAGRITLARTVDTFQASSCIDSIVLVVSEERLKDAQALCEWEKWDRVIRVVPGGPRRQDSVRHGLDALSEARPNCRWVMIHDGARPLVTPSILEEGLRAVQQSHATSAAVPVKDTIKQVRYGVVACTPDRSQLWALQTPQVFSFPLIHQAHHDPAIAQEDVTDDTSLLEHLGHTTTLFPGAYTNIKITTPEDILIAEALLRGQTQ